MKTVLLLALVLTDLGPDAFNCPKPRGTIVISDNWFDGMPTDIDRIMPLVLEVDVACRVDGVGRFVDCRHAARQDLTNRQSDVLARLISRMLREAKSDEPNQKCVATKIRWDFSGGPSKPAPDKAAG
ncbi:hypothetical protein [Erythrobacter sp. THAF29]|uniref:hypothetical protein n=1 Tax=Erythrobacter sp. THAF29 TaxID=2587851 RepID=UPI0012682BD6|nr:hypothetical protein [Erythrobacter sp. THAF29]QFT78296.1 hypothetical protein FIU90_12165 [Erythrobacter sp. THAF29]